MGKHAKPLTIDQVDEVLYLFDILQDNSVPNLIKETGFTITQINNVLESKWNI